MNISYQLHDAYDTLTGYFVIHANLKRSEEGTFAMKSSTNNKRNPFTKSNAG